MQIHRIGPVFGAELGGIQLADATAAQTDEIAAALATHEVLVIRDQQMDATQQLHFGRQFGELVISPFSPNADDAPELIVLDYTQSSPARLTDIWHADETYKAAPPKLTILRAVITPELGGDTMFASMRAAYAGLSDRMQRHIAGLTARHGFGRFDRLLRNDPEGVRKLYEVEQLHPRQDHPVVAMHPETGLPVLYVNRHFSERINELPEDEGRAVLDFLLGQTARPEYQLRVSWEPGTVVMWDNRSVQHYAPHDYFPQRRRMERVTVAGSVPIPDGQSGEVRVDKVEVDDVHVDPGDGQAAPTRQFQRG